MGRFVSTLLTILVSFLTFQHVSFAQYRGGALPTPPEIAEKYKVSSERILKAAPKALPPSVDLCNQLPPVGNQGNQGSCVGWAVGYYYKTFLEGKERGWDLSDPAHICSPAFIYNQINGNQDGGSFISDALKLLTRQGCASLSDMPYNPDDYTTLPNTTQLLNAINWRSDDFGFLFYSDSENCDLNADNSNNDLCRRKTPLTDENIDAMKAILANGNVLVISIPIFSNFYNAKDVYTGPTSDSTYEGGHAMVVCGYDDTIGGFKVRNSWGTNWGNNGETYLTYDFIKNYVWSGAFMTDRIGYEWKVISKVKVDSIYRGDLHLEYINSETKENFLYVGDYLYQSYFKDTRTYPSEIPIDLTDLNIPLDYQIYTIDLDKADSSKTNVGYISYVSVETDIVKLTTSENLPFKILSIPATLNVKGLGLKINSFSVNPADAYVDDNVIFSYDVASYLPTRCDFDLNNDGTIDMTISSCQGTGGFSYSYTQSGTYYPELIANNMVVSAKETTTITINEKIQDDNNNDDNTDDGTTNDDTTNDDTTNDDTTNDDTTNNGDTGGDDYTQITTDDDTTGPCSISSISRGTILESHLQPLRDFRDNILAKFELGKWFINEYYEFSSKYADTLSGNLFTKYFFVAVLLPIALSIEYYYLVLPLLALGLLAIFFRTALQRN